MSDSNDIVIGDDEVFLRLPDVLAKTGLGKTDLYERIKRGEFPRGRNYSGSRITFWLNSEVKRWQAEQLRLAVAA